MKIVLSAWLFAALATPALSASAPTARMDETFAPYTGPDRPGCAVGVKAEGQTPVQFAYGSADLEHSVPITPDTIFEAGSVSKQFTAASILLLAEDGKLQLTDDVRKYIPELPDYGRPITVDMLLSHTSGLRDWGEVMELAGWPRTSRVYTPAEVLQIAGRQRALNYAPGEAYSYTNTGYNLATLIVQRVSGETLADFTRRRLFGPLGMAHTSWRDDFRRIVPGRAVAYRPAPGGFEQEMPFEDTYGHGGLLTTVGDLLIWNDALTKGALGPTIDGRMRAQAVLRDGRRIAYARGLSVQTYQGRIEVAHSGSTAGYRAWLARLPGEGLSIALLCNRGDANAVELGHAVAAAFARPAPQNSPAAAADPDTLVRLPGTWIDERTGGLLRIETTNGALRVKGGPPLLPLGPALYRLGGAEIAFEGDRARRRTPDGETVVFRRIEAVRPTEADLRGLEGRYSSPEAGAILVASVRDGRLFLTPADRPSEPKAAEPLERDAFFADGALVRVQRGRDGRAVALRFTSPRVYALDFQRVATD